MQLQLQEENYELHLQMKLKDTELEKAKDDVKLFSAKIVETKESKLSADDYNTVCYTYTL